MGMIQHSHSYKTPVVKLLTTTAYNQDESLDDLHLVNLAKQYYHEDEF